MASFWLSFRDCGSTSYIIVMLTMVALMDAVASAIVVFGSKARQLGIMLSAITVCLGVGIIGVGEYGQISGRARTDEALQSMSGSTAINPSMRDEIRTEGYKESAQCVSIGIGASALPLIFGIVLLTSAVMKKKSEDS
jgi:hypothetical protein